MRRTTRTSARSPSSEAVAVPYRAFRIAYDGRGYRGFQRQPDQPTVEDALLKGLADLGVDHETDPGYAAASRTDAGVSAAAQTIAIPGPAWLDCEALNGALPDDIRAWARADVPEDFHPRYDAVERVYEYVQYAPEAALEPMREGCRRMTGRQDFRHLTAGTDDAVRTLQAASIDREDPFVRFRVRAGAFLRQQVRRMVTMLTELGRGERTIEGIDAILAGDALAGEAGIAPADPRSLVLVDIAYEDMAFERSPAIGAEFEGRALDRERVGAALRTVARELG